MRGRVVNALFPKSALATAAVRDQISVTRIAWKTRMKKIIVALIATVFAAVTFSAIAADEVKPADKPAKSSKKNHNKKGKKETEEGEEEEAPAAEKEKKK